MSSAGTLPDLLFAYGTLAPASPEEGVQLGWDADAVRGRLFDLGPYPALVTLNAPDARWVDGYVRRVAGDELVQRLDRYEGVDEGLYLRTRTTTRRGRLAWVYVYARPLPADATELLAAWEGKRVPWTCLPRPDLEPPDPGRPMA